WGRTCVYEGSPLKKKEPPLKIDETVGDLVEIRDAGRIAVEGVGLVVGLDGTGSDPELSWQRTKLINDMRKAKVPHPDKLLASPDKTMSMVLVKAIIPTGINTKDRFDVEVELTPGSTTKSLKGGHLLLTELRVMETIKGEMHEGPVLAKAYGPVLIGNATNPEDPKVGRVLGGARVKKEIPFTMVIHDRRKSFKTSGMLQAIVNTRFTEHQGGENVGMATAKTDEYLVLRVPTVYHQNPRRYFQVVKLLPVVDNTELRRVRLQQWGQELLNPKTAGLAALRLEGIGPNAVETLKVGLASPDPSVRFFAAEALAYLGDANGAEVLGQTAAERPEFRAYALAALAALDQPASLLHLRKLMAHPDKEVRYGAFNALRTLDPTDPYLGRVRVLREEEPEEEDEDNFATQIATRREPRREDPFTLYVVDCDGPPMIHVSRQNRCEIVLFGKGQQLLTPAVLGGAGSLLINAADGDTQAEISRIGLGKYTGTDQKVSCPLVLAEVIREAANLGATYPEVLNLLEAAHKQANLSSPLVVDSVPVPNDQYDRAQLNLPEPKKDEGVQKAKYESRLRRGLLDRFRRRSSR
ncbi:MAG: flagellar basal body P-ring protein FlgI, partial [Isosphaeraceae bacterium]|nr:flagellar basal body P-ring protein FlgI [Isosphaeraceae bacterium]